MIGLINRVLCEQTPGERVKWTIAFTARVSTRRIQLIVLMLIDVILDSQWRGSVAIILAKLQNTGPLIYMIIASIVSFLCVWTKVFCSCSNILRGSFRPST